MTIVDLRNLTHHLSLRLSADSHKGDTRLDCLDQLLSALDQKEKHLLRQLERKPDEKTLRHLQLELEVTRLQLKKGLAQRAELVGDA